MRPKRTSHAINDNQGQEQKHCTKKALIFKQEQGATKLEKGEQAKDMIKPEAAGFRLEHKTTLSYQQEPTECHSLIFTFLLCVYMCMCECMPHSEFL